MTKKVYKNSVESHQCIAIALVQLMKKKQFSEITIVEVCAKAGVSKNTFYHHYKNLSDVIYQTANKINSTLLIRAEKLNNPTIEDFILLTCQGWYEYKDFYKAFTQNEIIYIIKNIFKKNVTNFFLSHHYQGENNDLFLDFFSTNECLFLTWWCKHDFLQQPEEVAKYMTNFFCNNSLEIIANFLECENNIKTK